MGWRDYQFSFGPPKRIVPLEQQKLKSPLDATMTFGKFKGQLVRHILNHKEGVEYARWCVDNARSPAWRALFKSALAEARL